MTTPRVRFENIFGDMRAEQIWVDQDSKGSEILKIGIPTGERQHMQIPKYSEVTVSRTATETHDQYTHYKILDFDTADFDGDGHLDLYYNYVALTDQKGTGGQNTSHPVNHVLFHSDIKDLISQALGAPPPEETAVPASQLEWRVWDLESKTQRLEWDIRYLLGDQRALYQRLKKLEGKETTDALEIKTKQTQNDNITSEQDLERRLSDLEWRLQRKEWDMQDLKRNSDIIEQKLIALEHKKPAAPPTPTETTEQEQNNSNLEFTIWRLENDLRRLEWDMRDLQRKTREMDLRTTKLEG
ncbi:MAG: hypothetical protein HQM16_03075 [Deltaproteobacteria bacterium]|nr:hypothetical protein [Deltaproteobacteria bacterium]